MLSVVVCSVLLNASIRIDLNVPVAVRAKDALGLTELCFSGDLGAPLSIRKASLFAAVEE